MTEWAIRADGLSKKYVIRHAHLRLNDTLRDTLARKARELFSGHGDRAGRESFWALKDVTFRLGQGERLGIIGRNGAGKSTLLKILSRVVEPTSGRAEIRGRVASLLEVGTGFHSELTGRENIFLHGAVLGMSKADIRRKFDEIVEFSGVEKFLDTPVKRYSSGMYVRLAFAVGAHLEPEVLIVDEVLAVGDLQFQKKCLGKMEDVSREGRTVLFVSHSMASMLGLTSRCILLSDGRVAKEGPSQDVVAYYQSAFVEETLGQTDLTGTEHYGTGKGKFVSIDMRALDAEGRPIAVPTTGCDLAFDLRIDAAERFRDAAVALTIYDDSGTRIVDVSTITRGEALTMEHGDRAAVGFRLRNVLLKGGTYSVGLWLGVTNQEDVDGVRHATSFRMEHRPEDTRFSPAFPGCYVCAFDHRISVRAGGAA